MEMQSLYFIADKFRKFRAPKFRDSEKFAKFSLREMFSPKWDKANFFLNYKIFFCEMYPLYGIIYMHIRTVL